jgi:hypothetical protein
MNAGKIEAFYRWLRLIAVSLAVILLIAYSVLHASLPFDFELNVPELMEVRHQIEEREQTQREREAYEKFCREHVKKEAGITQDEIMDFIKRATKNDSDRESMKDSACGPSGFEGTTLDRGHD